MLGDDLEAWIGPWQSAFGCDRSAVHVPRIEVTGVVAVEDVVLAVAIVVTNVSEMPCGGVCDASGPLRLDGRAVHQIDPHRAVVAGRADVAHREIVPPVAVEIADADRFPRN